MLICTSTFVSDTIDDEMKRLVDVYSSSGCTGQESIQFREFTLVS